MKTQYFQVKVSILLLLIFIPFLGFSQNDGKSMKDIYKKVGQIVDLVDEKKMEIVRMEFDLIIKQNPKNNYRVLYPDYTYSLIILGDYRVEEMQIKVYKSSGGKWVYVKSADNIGASSNSSSGSNGGSSKGSTSSSNKVKGMVILDVKPDARTEYRVDVKVTKYAEGWNGGHYAAIFVHK